MKRYELVLEENALSELESIHSYVSKMAGVATAEGFVASILSECESLRIAPKRGMIQPELGENTRLIGIVKGRVSITFHVGEDVVTIASIYYAGWNR